MIKTIQEPEDLMTATSVPNSLAIMREISKIHFWEQMRKLMPMIALELAAAGVDFSKANIPTEEQVEALVTEAMWGEIW